MAYAAGNGEELRAVRASDAERELAVAVLQEHCVAGRITVEELGDRVARAYEARTRADLARVTADLPTASQAEIDPSPRSSTRRRRDRPPVLPGHAPFSERFQVSKPRARVRAEALSTIAPSLHGYGYELRSATAEMLELVREERPAWTIVAAVLAFPFGLLCLLHKRRSRIVLSFEGGANRGTLLTVYGVAPLSVRRAFAELRP